jgi:hypothetical protein
MLFVLGVNCRHLCCNVHFYVRTGCQLSTLMLQCTFLCSYRVSIVDTYVAMYIFIHPSPRSVQHKMQVLQNLEENGRHACRGQHCSLQFCPRKFTGRLIAIKNHFSACYFSKFPSAHENRCRVRTSVRRNHDGLWGFVCSRQHKM